MQHGHHCANDRLCNTLSLDKRDNAT